jgi:hypothetical protein
LHEIEGTLVQRVRPFERFEMPIVDLTHLPIDLRLNAAMQMIHAEMGKRFDLEKGPIFDSRLVRIGEEDNILYLNVHHVATDVWSLRIFLGELSALYAAFTAGRPSPLDEVTLQYADFAAWQQDMMRSGAFDNQLEHWRKQFANSGTVPAYDAGPAGSIDFPIAAAVTEELTGFGKRESVSGFMILLSAFHLLLRLQTSSNDTVIGTALSNRARPETENMIGFLRARLNDDMTGRDLLEQVRESVLTGFGYQDAVPESFQGVSPDGLQGQPFSAWFALNQDPGAMSIASLPCEFMSVPAASIARQHLTLRFRRGQDGLFGRLEYRQDLFDEAQAREIVRKFETILELMMLDPSQTVSQLLSHTACGVNTLSIC